MVRTAIIGISGYAGGELARILSRHPEAEITYAASESNAGKPLAAAFPGLSGVSAGRLICQSADLAAAADAAEVIFLAQETGAAMKAADMFLEKGKKVIDLSADFRLRDPATFETWYKTPHTATHLLGGHAGGAVYGLPEWNFEALESARLVANPGCHVTAALLALLPLLDQGLIAPQGIVIDSKTGVSGAGRTKTDLIYRYSEMNEGVRPYNIGGTHRHTPEIEQNLSDVAGEAVTVTFTPHLIPMTRGVLATCYARLNDGATTAEEITAVFRDTYNEETAPFVIVRDPGDWPNTKDAYGSNFCHLAAAADSRTGMIIVVSALDNLIKGAAGQAVQNMNLICNLPETAGLEGGGIWPVKLESDWASEEERVNPRPLPTAGRRPLTLVPGGVCAAQGFRVAGVRCGIKRKRRDVALLICDGGEATAAATFTQNRLRAPCAERGETILRNGDRKIRGIIVNAGNANAGNGPQGVRDNENMAILAAQALGCEPERVLTASTGIIGNPLPMERVGTGIADAARLLAATPEAASEAAEAILTTDTFSKEFAVETEIGGVTIRVGGMAKGSGMIAPNMATMLAFITTDAMVAPPALQAALHQAVKVSFNRLTVDGDTSTNDSCFLLASGAAGKTEIADTASPEYAAFADALKIVCVHLAKEVARDGEGATKLVTITVSGAETEEDAARIGKTIAESPLVKTALFGNDPNWGRILAAAGRAGVAFDPQKVTATLAGTMIFAHGVPTDFDAAALSKAMAAKELTITVDLASGAGRATFYTCDFSYDYVRINAEYHT